MLQADGKNVARRRFSLDLDSQQKLEPPGARVTELFVSLFPFNRQYICLSKLRFHLRRKTSGIAEDRGNVRVCFHCDGLVGVCGRDRAVAAGFDDLFNESVWAAVYFGEISSSIAVTDVSVDALRHLVFTAVELIIGIRSVW